MAGQRPPRAAVRAAVRACLADLPPGERVLVALSGGPDSLALAAAAATVSAQAGLICEAVVVDHQLQPGSHQVAARAAEQARLLGCADTHVVRVTVAAGPGSGGLEAAARHARYRALEQLAAGGSRPAAAVVLLGHTRDDQAETVLLGLARGSGTRSLAGMAPVVGRYRRPLLDLPRAVVQAAAAEQAAHDDRLGPWVDPHNAERVFARVRIRHDVLPRLEAALGPGVVAGLTRTAALARADADALDAWAEAVWKGLPHEVRNAGPAAEDPAARDAAGGPGAAGPLSGDGQVARLGPLTSTEPVPAAILNRVVRRFLIAAGSPAGDLGADHVARAAALLARSAPATAHVALPGGLRARREQGALVVRA